MVGVELGETSANRSATRLTSADGKKCDSDPRLRAVSGTRHLGTSKDSPVYFVHSLPLFGPSLAMCPVCAECFVLPTVGLGTSGSGCESEVRGRSLRPRASPSLFFLPHTPSSCISIPSQSVTRCVPVCRVTLRLTFTFERDLRLTRPLHLLFDSAPISSRYSTW